MSYLYTYRARTPSIPAPAPVTPYALIERVAPEETTMNAATPHPTPESADRRLTRREYARAEQFLPENVAPFIYDAYVRPSWIKGSDRFWYRAHRPTGTEFVLVDPARGSGEPAFDHARLAAALSRAMDTAYTPADLPFAEIDFVDSRTLRIEVGEQSWICSLESYACSRDETWTKRNGDETASPDGTWAAFARDDNLYVRSLPSGEERQLTTDGESWYGYAAKPEGRGTTIADKLLGRRYPPVILWSPDSKRLVTQRLDERQVAEMHLTQTTALGQRQRPLLHSFRYPQVGDEHLPMAELILIDIASGTTTPVRYEPLPATYMSPIEARRVWWSKDGRHLYVVHHERGHRALHLLEVDATTGEARTLRTESSTTPVDLAQTPFDRPNAHILASGEIVWYSARDGWAHLYLYAAGGDAAAEAPDSYQLTSGPWAVFEIAHVDEEHRRVYFLAGGREDGHDPYFRHLYRVRRDGTDLELLTPEDADHAVTFSPSGTFFIDARSRVDMAPVTVLRSSEGRIICTLEEGDVTMLRSLGWRFPERFTVKARDGVTDLYGVIVRPTTFDPEQTYPVLDSIYPGPQVLRTPKRFAGGQGPGRQAAQWLWQEQALAEVGFVVIAIDGQGTPYRSRAFMEVAYGERFGEAGGLADHVAGIRQLAARDPSLDLDRVGIYGHSGGGYASARALMKFPDFYKVAVSSAGNHDQRGYLAAWGERYIGLPDGNNYQDQVNAHLARQLRGKLLLVYAGLDDNVPPALTMQLIDALMQANKDFDLLVLPHCDHAFIDFREGREVYEARLRVNPYFIRRRWDFFVQHLLGAQPPEDYVIGAPPNWG